MQTAERPLARGVPGAARRPPRAWSCSTTPAEGIYPLADRRRGPRRGAGRPHPPRPVARALPQPLGRRRQPAQGRRDQRRPGRRAARRARPGPRPGRRRRSLRVASLLAAIASATLIVAGSLVVGQAILALCGRPDPSWLSGPLGLALLLITAAIVVGVDRSAPAVAITLGLIVAAAIVALLPRWRKGRGRAVTTPVPALIAAALAATFAAIPFIAAGNVGILGVGLVNDDMASHLLLTDWIREGFRPEPVLVDQGYPLGPHALVAGLGDLLGASSVDVFAGLTLAIPALMALVAYSALDGLRTASRVGASALVALPYLAAAYLAQEAFKEPIIALFLLAFALLLPRCARLARRDPARASSRRGPSTCTRSPASPGSAGWRSSGAWSSGPAPPRRLGGVPAPQANSARRAVAAVAWAVGSAVLTAVC